MAQELPSGTVTFLFTDVEGSTRLLHELGAERYADALAAHRGAMREAFSAHGGVEVDTQGDAFFVAFPTAPGALAAAAEALAALSIPVRMGIHTGTPLLTDEGYVGADIHRAARIAAAGHGEQVLVSASTAALVADGLRDLGEHRLKDLSAPERIFQLGERDFPPLKTLYQTNLPIPATPFLGREHELAELQKLLAHDDVRLLTLSGPGGTGKTRLALQAAAEAADRYPDGVFWVPLAPLNEPALVVEQAAQAVGAKIPLAEFVGDKRLLLLFDNFEHVIAAAGDLATLQASCPNLDLLVTSRELLALPGEQAYPVPPLVPEEGTELFLARARAARPDFRPDDAVRELCTRLDNLPLALELAAARVRVLTPAQLLERLSDRLDLLKAGRGVDPRQQTLRATLEWSHDLLDEEEQRLFARLAVFAGGCTLDAAEAVTDADLDTLQSLVDKSLVRMRDGERFWMLETIREYALERLAEMTDAADIRARHADYFLSLVESAPGAADSPALSANIADTTQWRRKVDRDIDNVRAAVVWFRATSDLQREFRIIFPLAWLFLWVRGSMSEAGQMFDDFLRRADGVDPWVRVDALQSLSHFGHHIDDDARRRLAEQSLILARQLGDTGRIEWSLRRLALRQGDPQEARRMLLECERLARELPEKGRLAWIQQNLGSIALERGDYADAYPRLREGFDLFEALGGRWQAANVLNDLSCLAILEGREADARRLLAETLERALDLGMEAHVAQCLEGFAALAADPERAGRLLGAASAIRDRTGGVNEDDYATFEERIRREAYDTTRARLGDRFAESWASGRALAIEEVLSLTADEVYPDA